MRLLLGLLLLVSVTLSAQTGSATLPQSPVNEITPTGVQPVKKKPLFHLSDGLAPYVLAYAKAMKADNWRLDIFVKNDFVVVFSHEVDIDMTQYAKKGAAGVALGMDKDDLVYVVINTEAWVTLEDYEKQDLINHELMHDIFNVRHTPDEEEDRLMHPASYPKSWGETMSRLIGAIHDLNEAYEQ